MKRSFASVAKGQHTLSPDECKDFTVSRGTRSGTGSPKKRPRTTNPGEDTIPEEMVDEGEGYGLGKNSIRCAKQLPIAAASPVSMPALPPSFAGAPPHHGNLLTEEGSSTQVHTSEPIEESSDRENWERLYILREQGLEKERQKSDPHGD
ncbi:MAG: hypothetical protein Q9211_000590 [Gyalolechia sp. 1 TL-2023]